MMIKRRTMLWGLLGIAIAGCRSNNISAPLRIKLLARSVPSQVLKAFSRQTPTLFETEPTLADIYRQLQWWQSQKASALPLWKRLFQIGITSDSSSENEALNTSLVTLSDPWLDHAIRERLIQPLSLDVPSVDRFPEPWQRLLRRDNQGKMTANGALWAVPYRTQGLIIAYQKSIFTPHAKNIRKWADLWRPELAGRIAMPNQPRLAVAIVLKALSYSANDEDALLRDDVKEQLLALYRQVKVFDSQDYLKALVNEDVWLAVGWSGDILATLVRYRRLGAVSPQEGTILTSDLWVSPNNSEPTAAAQSWIEFCLQAPIAAQISVSSHGMSPLFFTPDVNVPDALPGQMQQLLKDGEVLLPFSRRGEVAFKKLFSVDDHHE
ncbi:MAG: extracellular solute-binding protein [Symploca sp. SIO2G7]|nr:extracellular solute-binding protein [Symploca sp. SIO2G7]